MPKNHHSEINPYRASDEIIMAELVTKWEPNELQRWLLAIGMVMAATAVSVATSQLMEWIVKTPG